MAALQNKRPELFSQGTAYLYGISNATMSASNKYINFPLPTQKNSALSYNPFSYYDYEVPDYIVTACLGSNITAHFTTSGQEHFHDVFASLYKKDYGGDYSRILAWISHFGIPRKSTYQAAEARCKKLNLKIMSIPIIEIIKDIKVFNLAKSINLHWQVLLKKSKNKKAKATLVNLLLSDLNDPKPFIFYDDIIERFSKMYLLGQMSQHDAASHVRIYRDEMKKKIIASPEHFASRALHILIQCKQITPEFNISAKTKKPFLNWLCPDPMTALWAMLLFDTTSSRVMRQCTAPGCSRFFHAKRSSAAYCSGLCQNRAKVTNHRKKILIKDVVSILQRLISNRLLATNQHKPNP